MLLVFREYIYNFFYPADYLALQPSEPPEPGYLRMHKSFDFKMSMQQSSTLDILFTKNKETQVTAKP